MRLPAFLLVASLAATPQQPSSSIQEAPRARRIDLQKRMTTDERRQTGVASLSPAQRKALEEWLYRWGLGVYRQGKTKAMETADTSRVTPPRAAYAGVGMTHFLEDVSSNGAILTLNDGSIWQVEDTDQIESALWLPTSDIVVIVADRPIGLYRYVLINKDDGEKVFAKYLGNQ